MVVVNVRDVAIEFPFAPYPAQEQYMAAVIDALNGRCNALLESPTGTGKTMCLLCATLAWTLKQRGGVATVRRPLNVPTASTAPQSSKIVYTSRTHTQLAQVIREFKRTAYAGQFSMALLGSREYMCVNTQVTRLPTAQAQNTLCNTLRSNKNCRYFRNINARGNAISAEAGGKPWIHDMEDLVSEGRKLSFCPYFYERDEAKTADIVFLPYNYVLDHTIQRQLPFDLKDCILIVDEAHNLPGVLSSSGTMNLSPLDLSNAVNDCARAIAIQRALFAKREEEGGGHDAMMTEQLLASLKIVLCRLEEAIAAEKPDGEEDDGLQARAETVAPHDRATPDTSAWEYRRQRQREIVRGGAYMLSFLARALITRDLMGSSSDGGQSELNEVMTSAITLLTQNEASAPGISKVQQFLCFVFDKAAEWNDELLNEGCRFVIQDQGGGTGSDTTRKSGAPRRPGERADKLAPHRRSLGFWCLDTSAALDAVAAKQRSLILTSGTLSPLDHFAAEIGVAFDVRLQNSHVIQADQVLGSILCKSPNGVRLNGAFAFRSSTDYRVGLGMALVNVARHVPGGMLVFFPSYTALHTTVSLWRTGIGTDTGLTPTIWGMLSELRPVFVEPSDGTELAAVVGGFQKAVDDGPCYGAVLLAVCRGKISEGVDFADRHGRCVVVTGIPFANHTDLFVRLKREYFTQVAAKRPLVGGKLFTGDDWYRNEAMRAVNQCVGRVVRHKNDYGAVVLADERFSGLQASLSAWVSRSVVVHREFRDLYSSVAKFFAAHRHSKQRGPSPSPVVGVRNGAGPVSGVPEPVGGVPHSAGAAEQYARQQESLLASEAAAQAQKLTNSISGLPQAPEVLAPRAPVCASAALNPFAAGASRRRVADAAAVITVAVDADAEKALGVTEVPTSVAAHPIGFQKQVIPRVPVVGEGEEPPPPRSSCATANELEALAHASSKEYCAFLKARLPATQYANFKGILLALADLRTNPASDAQAMRTAFVGHVDALRVVLSNLGDDGCAVALSCFGKHLPQELQAYYAHVLRKRKRDPSS